MRLFISRRTGLIEIFRESFLTDERLSMESRSEECLSGVRERLSEKKILVYANVPKSRSPFSKYDSSRQKHQCLSSRFSICLGYGISMASDRSACSQRRPPPPIPGEETSDLAMDKTVFVWLEAFPADYEKCRDHFCGENSIYPRQWFFFDDKHKCKQFLEQLISNGTRIILVTSGSLGTDLISCLHHCEPLDSIYIYCKNIEKYKRFSRPHSKVLGVHDDPVALVDQLRHDLDKRLSQGSVLINSDVARIDTCPYESVTPPFFWNPWELNSCTKSLTIQDQVTIAVIESEPIAFELILSTASQLVDMGGENQYSVTIEVNHHHVAIGEFINHQPHFLNRTNDAHQSLRSTAHLPNEERVYWIHFSKENLSLIVGIGEIRPRFQVLQVRLAPQYSALIGGISNLHVKINKVWQNFEKISHLQDHFRLLIDSSPFVEPDLLVVRSRQPTSFNDHCSFSGLSFSTLDEPLRTLYNRLTHFKFDDENFPDLIQAIEYSINQPQGWCHRKIDEKTSHSPPTKRHMTHLRLTLDSLVIEIWPVGHFSPIHHHRKAYGMFRVLHGCILIRLFPYLGLHFPDDLLIEYLLHREQMTWMTPQWNQTHQMKNVEMDSCCILLQCYDYDQSHQAKDREIFDVMVKEGSQIQTVTPPSDMNFVAFKELIKEEWDQRDRH